MSNEKPCINRLIAKIKGVDDKMCTLSERLQMIKKLITTQEHDDEEEVCPDIAESEKAVVEAIEKLYVDELLTRDPEGDA